MKIEKIDKITIFYVTTDEEEYNEYKRYSSEHWTVSMGESDELVYDCEKLEELFQKELENKSSNKK